MRLDSSRVLWRKSMYVSRRIQWAMSRYVVNRMSFDRLGVDSSE